MTKRLPYILSLLLCCAVSIVPSHAQVRRENKASATVNGLMSKEDKAKSDKRFYITDQAGVDPTGATNCITQMQAAADFCRDNGRELYFPDGAYLNTTATP